MICESKMMAKLLVSMLLLKAEIKPVATAAPRYTRMVRRRTPRLLPSVFSLLGLVFKDVSGMLPPNCWI